MSKTEWMAKQEERPPEKFWTDFGNMVAASIHYEDTDEYLETLVKWCDVLGRRYDNKIAHFVILDYYDGQCRRAQDKIPT